MYSWKRAGSKFTFVRVLKYKTPILYNDIVPEISLTDVRLNEIFDMYLEIFLR